jgi:hypothetical protein
MSVSLGLVVFLSTASGCTSTETGNPPLAPGIDLEDVDIVALSPPPPDGGIPAPVTVFLSGGPGTLGAETERLWLVPLDRLDPAVAVTPTADGSFVATLALDLGDALRFQIDEGTRRRTPVDGRFEGPGAGLTPVTHPQAECLLVPLDVIADVADSTARIRIANTCGDDVQVSSVRARLGMATVDGGAFDLATGETRDLEVTLPPGAEDVVLIEIAAPAVDRRAVTVRRPPAA